MTEKKLITKGNIDHWRQLFAFLSDADEMFKIDQGHLWMEVEDGKVIFSFMFTESGERIETELTYDNWPDDEKDEKGCEYCRDGKELESETDYGGTIDIQGNVLRSMHDDIHEVVIKFCPFCGTKLEGK